MYQILIVKGKGGTCICGFWPDNQANTIAIS